MLNKAEGPTYFYNDNACRLRYPHSTDDNTARVIHLEHRHDLNGD